MTRALIVVDLQQGFDDPVWGRRDNPDCEANVGRLLDAAREHGDRGYAVDFVLDATHTFEERAADGDGTVAPETFTRVTATNLHGHFATVRSTTEVLAGG